MNKNHDHDGEFKICFWLSYDMTTRFDDALETNGYKNRADWFREKVRQEIEKASHK